MCKSRLFWICISISTFFVFSLALTFHYNTVKLPSRSDMSVVASLNQFTEFLFADFSFVLPLTLFLGFLFHRGLSLQDLCHSFCQRCLKKRIFHWQTIFVLDCNNYLSCVQLSNGIPVYFLHVGKTSKYNLFHSCNRWLFSFTDIMLCWIFFTYVYAKCLLRFRSLVLITSTILLGALYLYLTKISTALDLSYSLYQYWIVGLSGNMKIDLYWSQLPMILITIFAYVLLPAALSYAIFQKADLSKEERR